MIWVNHDLYRNFLQSFNKGDMNLSLDIFRSEISDILTQKSESFFSLLDKIKIKYNKKATYQELLDLIIREMKVNEKFVRGISFIIGESNEVNKKYPNISWIKLLDSIKRGIEQIANYFEENPRQERYFVKKTLEMIEVKSSITGDDTRDLTKKDNSLLWFFGIVALGVAGYLVYRHFNKITEDRLRAESLKAPDFLKQPIMQTGGQMPSVSNSLPITEPYSLDPEYNVPTDVLIPEQPIMNNPNPPIQNGNLGNQNMGVQIQVQPMPNNNSNQQKVVSI
jgi:hypothetical protein